MPPIITQVTDNNGAFALSSKLESGALTGSISKGSKLPSQITVMLEGSVFNAMLSVDVWTLDVSKLGQPKIDLPDCDYTIIANVSDINDCKILTLSAVSTGNNTGVTLTLADRTATQEFKGHLASNLSASSYLLYNRPVEGAFAERGRAWVEHSTNSLPGKRAKKSLHGSAGCMVIPSNTVLNLRALVNAFDRLSTQQIEKGIQELIDILDYRNGDFDLEVDVDFEPEIEEASAQLI